jgi:UDP-N-acetylglucosamine 2-epimerase (non-hydrolysing)
MAAKKVMLVFGTRPEAIKMCPLVKELKNHPEFSVRVCVTGQHREMLRQVLDCFEITPDYNLDIMRPQQTLFDITTAVLQGMRPVLEKEAPDLVLVHGDTSTAFATALACFYLHIAVGHVEAGLRTNRLDSPFPEEFNRQCISLLAQLNFAPTEAARQNLLRENHRPDTIFVTGNTAIDALHTTVRSDYSSPALDPLLGWAAGGRLILLTAHRRENSGEPFRHIFAAVRRLAQNFAKIRVVYPLHPNPTVRVLAHETLDGLPNVRLIEPLDVLDFHNLMARSELVLTDSGGIQEEAPALGKPVLVLRDTTERPEGVQAGTLELVGTQEEKIYQAAAQLLTDSAAYRAMAHAVNPYGDGTACQKIAQAMLNASR